MVSVLVVDDDDVMRRLISLVLSSEGIEVQPARGGEHALELLVTAAKEPDLILLDLAMPGMDGREVFRRIRASGYVIPIVFCSAYGAQEACVELGAHGAIAKPFDPEVLIATVRRQIAQV